MSGMIEPWRVKARGVWHIGWAPEPGVPGRCIGGCEQYHCRGAEDGPAVPGGERVCAKALRAIEGLLGARYRVVGAEAARDTARLDWLETRRHVSLTDGDTHVPATRAAMDRLMQDANIARMSNREEKERP